MKKFIIITLRGGWRLIKKKREFHGLRKSPEYNLWNSMKQRCHNPNSASYERYGAVGVRVCERWIESFASFYKDMGPRPSNQHSVERIENSQGYCPGNCKWATAKEQANNTKNNLVISAFGKTKTLSMWAHETGIPSFVIRSRIQILGWPPEKAVCSPVGKMIEYKGKSDTLAGWCQSLGLDYGKVQQRIKKLGWSTQDAFEKH
jgi:hypothetical protein